MGHVALRRVRQRRGLGASLTEQLCLSLRRRLLTRVSPRKGQDLAFVTAPSEKREPVHPDKGDKPPVSAVALPVEVARTLFQAGLPPLQRPSWVEKELSVSREPVEEKPGGR